MKWLASIIVSILVLTQSSGVMAYDVKTYIPENAPKYLPVLKDEANKYFPELETPEYFAGLIEQESCISLTHKRCWLPTSELKSAREQGVGLGQITRAYKADGSIRFDALSDLRKAHMAELKELSWGNVASRPDLQIRSIILMSKDNFKALFSLSNQYDRVAMMDAAYNGGLGGVKKDRMACGLAANCNPQIWFDNVEKTCMKSKKPLYGNRNACDINREHVHSAMKVRPTKYKKYFK